MNHKEYSPYTLFFVLTLGIFTAELFIMFVIEQYAMDDAFYLKFLDGLLLVVIISPLTYFFAIKPLREELFELKRSQSAVTSLTMHDEALERDKAKDRALLASIGEGMLAIDSDGKILIVNPAAERILGWDEQELLGQVMVEKIPSLDDKNAFIPPEKRAMERILHKRNTGTISKTSRYVRKDGTIVPLAITINPIMLDNKPIGAVEIFRDITKELEIERMRQDLLSLASHQLRTPLSGTKWLIETLQKGLQGPLNEKQTEYINEIYKINERMTSLVSEMLSVLRIESGTVSAKRETVTIASLFEGIREMLGQAANARRITLDFNDPGKATIQTDPMFLRNILESFVSNAILYSHEGSEVTVTAENQDTSILFSVKDFGIGIPKEEQSPLFTRFYRASNAKVFNTKSSGLGLYIAATLADKIGAKVDFESEEGKGSTFFVRVPKYIDKKLVS